MPILYIHGVNTRSRDGFFALKPFLERLVAPVLSDDPENVLIDDVYWGDVGVKFAWEGAARPGSRLLGMGASHVEPELLESVLTAAAFSGVLKDIPDAPMKPASTDGLISGGASAGSRKKSTQTLEQLDGSALSDLLVSMLAAEVPESATRAKLALVADEVAMEVAQQGVLNQIDNPEQQIEMLLEKIKKRAGKKTDDRLAAMGTPAWLSGVYDRLSETLGRAVGLPAYTVSVFAAELRKPLNEAISLFIGDVFEYLKGRGDKRKPGEIQLRLLNKLKQAQTNAQQRNEPLIILSHSMGGQIVYDAITYFLPESNALSDLRIDFWCATASQVGFFEEAKLFLASKEEYRLGNQVPFPRQNLKAWWNVWDHNDFLSFTVKDIIADVDDESYDSGMSLLAAHGGYLERPSFYRRLAEKVRIAVLTGGHG